MKTVYIFLVLVFNYISAFAQVPIIIHATSQNWHGGAYGSGSGINYKIQIIAPLGSDKFKVDKMWVKDKSVETKTTKGLPKLESQFKKGDTLYISAAEYFPSKPNLETANTVIEKDVVCPKKYKGDALLRYVLNGKKKYLVVKKIESLATLNYP